MKKYVCPVCGYVYEGDNPPDKCPLCGAKLELVEEGEMVWASEHVVGDSSKLPKEIAEGLRMNFNAECSEVGMYLAMARVAHREGYPEIGLYYERAAHEEAEHAAETYSNRIYACTSPDDPGCYYAVLTHQTMGRILLVFSPNDNVLENLKSYIPRQAGGHAFYGNRPDGN